MTASEGVGFANLNPNVDDTPDAIKCNVAEAQVAGRAVSVGEGAKEFRSTQQAEER